MFSLGSAQPTLLFTFTLVKCWCQFGWVMAVLSGNLSIPIAYALS